MIPKNYKFTKRTFVYKTCVKCGKQFDASNFIKVQSPLYPDGYSNWCNSCIDEYLAENEYNWQEVDRVCRTLDIPYVPAEYERLCGLAADRKSGFMTYSQVFLQSEYNGLDWGDYFRKFKELRETGNLEDELPEIREERINKLREKWGGNYDEEELNQLEQLYGGILASQNVAGAMQIDQAKKICKISLEIDSRIREGVDFDKMLASYDKLVKTAEFTPKNAKNASDFDSTGELCRWLEKRGWVNRFYDNVTRDIVDETIKNIQNYNQRLYTNEGNIAEEITRRVEALKSIEEASNTYTDFDSEFDRDAYEVDGYQDLINDDFDPGGDFKNGV